MTNLSVIYETAGKTVRGNFDSILVSVDTISVKLSHIFWEHQIFMKNTGYQNIHYPAENQNTQLFWKSGYLSSSLKLLLCL